MSEFCSSPAQDPEDAMMRYICEEPQIIARIFANRAVICADFVRHFQTHSVKRIYFSGHGSPYHVSVALQFMAEKLLHVEATTMTSALFNHHCTFDPAGVYQPEEMLLICPAHSGRTRGAVEAAKAARARGIPVACTTLHRDGMLAQLCDIVIEKDTGTEESYPESKGHFASLAILMLCVLESARALGTISGEEYARYTDAFSRLPQTCAEAIEKTNAWYDKYKYLLIREPTISLIGYGANCATALEGALKIMESTLKHCAGYEVEEFMHGQLEPVRHDTPLFFLCPRDGAATGEQERMHTLLRYCRACSDSCFAVCRPDDPLADEKSICCNFTDCEFADTLEYLIPFQILCHRLARDMGLSTLTSFHDGSSARLGTRCEG